jgi:hypothetical protein
VRVTEEFPALVGVPLPVGVVVGVALTLTVLVVEPVPDALAPGERLGVGVPDSEALSESVDDGVVGGVPVGDGEGTPARDSEGDRERLGEPDVDRDGSADGVGTAEAVEDMDADKVTDGDCLVEAVRVETKVADTSAEPEGVRVVNAVSVIV